VNPPAAGVYNFTTFVQSLRDADGDGIDNALDVCALVANAGWNPRAEDAVHDPDGDGLPNECDPQGIVAGPEAPAACPPGYSGYDQDGDCVPNRADNCPTVNQLRVSGASPGPENLPVMRDRDLDAIGDACDPNVESPNGLSAMGCITTGVTVSQQAAPAIAATTTGLHCLVLTAAIPPVIMDVPTPAPPAVIAANAGGNPAVVPIALPATGAMSPSNDRVPISQLVGAVLAMAIAGCVYAWPGMRRRR
jgi:hypothetical protein